MATYRQLNQGPLVGSLAGEPIYEWLHISDGRFLNFEGTVRPGQTVPFDDTVVLVNEALLYREDPSRKGMTLEEMQDLVARGERIEKARDRVLLLAREAHGRPGQIEIPDDAALYPGDRSGTWVGIRVRVEGHDEDQARREAMARYDKPGALEIQSDAPVARDRGAFWVEGVAHIQFEG